jgi:hypothetical protein
MTKQSQINRIRESAQDHGPTVEVHVRDLRALLLALDEAEARYDELRHLRLADLERDGSKVAVQYPVWPGFKEADVVDQQERAG